MEQKPLQLDQEAFSCAICLDLPKSPVTIPCGHNYCLRCIQRHWDREDQKQLYSCPQCRQGFTPRPVLVKNTMLAFLVEEMKKSGLQEAENFSAGPQHVLCDMCTGTKLKAVKSCLQCLVSYCETHLQPHYDVAPLKKHQLVVPCMNLQDKICSEHNKVMEMFCRTDQQCICSLCSVEQHKDHDITSAATERSQRQRELETKRQEVLQIIQTKEREVELFQQDSLAVSRSADEAVKHSEDSYTRLIRLLEKRRTELEQQIRSQQKTHEARVQELQDQLQQDISELKRTLAQLDSLYLTPDHNQFLNQYPSMITVNPLTDSARILTSPQPWFKEVKKAVSELSKKLEQTLNEGMDHISLTPNKVCHSLKQLQPSTREDFLNYSQDVTLDPNTAHTELSLSDENRRVTYKGFSLKYSDHSDRFSDWRQVLSREGLSGRCYWEVEWSAKEELSIAVSYKETKRKGRSPKCLFGHSDQSWAFYCEKNKGSFFFNGAKSQISGRVLSKIGVYLDHSAGVLSFYSVCQTMTLLHKVQTTFTKPLYVGLGLYGVFIGDTAHFPKLK